MISNAKLLGVVAGLGLAFAIGSSAQAQLPGAGQARGWGDGYVRYGTPVQALPTPFSQGGSCVQWCVADTSPCDPDYYKVADRRCNVNQNGYFSK